MERQSQDDYDKQMVSLATKSFAEHTIPFCNHDAGQLTLKRPGSSFYLTHCTLYAGTLCVYGDIDTVVFQTYAGKTILGAVEWMGHASPTYALEKATRGMSGEIVRAFEEAVAVDDVLSYIDDLEPDDDAREAIRGALMEWHSDYERDMHSLQRALYDVDYDYELIGDVGMVRAPRMFYAQAACARAYQLLSRDLRWSIRNKLH